MERPNKQEMVAAARQRASEGVNSGRGDLWDRHYLDYCRGFHEPSGTLFIYTRDVGHHMSGWWKNPDYERCLHLSLSFWDTETRGPAPKDRKLTEQWLDLFFAERKRLLWCEPPTSPEGKKRDVWHYRLFCDAGWQPILPRGEVYSREFTEAGWKSWSDLKAGEEEAPGKA